VWDVISHTPGFIADGTVPEIADNSYHNFKSDIKLMKHHGIQNYRMSISWPRIMPQGK
jgi:beta-glucosidase/6-phospho-beta-glucosidase/beta-galactosidase